LACAGQRDWLCLLRPFLAGQPPASTVSRAAPPGLRSGAGRRQQARAVVACRPADDAGRSL